LLSSESCKKNPVQANTKKETQLPPAPKRQILLLFRFL
jgi:hypothetical protein